MLLKWNDPAVRLTGRWSRNNPDCATATANGSYFEFAFKGRVAVMHFDVTLNAAPYPHLYVEIDGESRVEAPLDQYLRVFAKDADANHVARVIFERLGRDAAALVPAAGRPDGASGHRG